MMLSVQVDLVGVSMRSEEHTSELRGVLPCCAVKGVGGVVPSQPGHWIRPGRFCKGEDDALGPGGFGRSEHVDHSIAGRVAAAVGDTIDVPTGVEHQIAVWITSRCRGTAERIEDRFNAQLAIRGWNKLVQDSLAERAAVRGNAIQVSLGVQQDRTTGCTAVRQIAE